MKSRSRALLLNPVATSGILLQKFTSTVWVVDGGRHFARIARDVAEDASGDAVIGIYPYTWTPELGVLLSAAPKVLIGVGWDPVGEAMAAEIRRSIAGSHVFRIPRPEGLPLYKTPRTVRA